MGEPESVIEQLAVYWLYCCQVSADLVLSFAVFYSWNKEEDFGAERN